MVVSVENLAWVYGERIISVPGDLTRIISIKYLKLPISSSEAPPALIYYQGHRITISHQNITSRVQVVIRRSEARNPDLLRLLFDVLAINSRQPSQPQHT